MFRFMTLLLSLLYSALLWASPFVIVTDPPPPYEYMVNNIPVGMDVEILSEIAKKQHLQIQFNFVPWARAMIMVKEGKADGIISLLKTPERESFLNYPETPIYEDRILLFANSSFKNNILALKDLEGHTVGVVADNSYSKEFDENLNIIKEIVSDQEMGMRKLIANRTPLFIINEMVGLYMIKEMRVQNIRPLTFVVNQNKYYLAVSRKSPRSRLFFKKISQGLKDAQKSGVLSEIKKKYLQK